MIHRGAAFLLALAGCSASSDAEPDRDEAPAPLLIADPPLASAPVAPEPRSADAGGEARDAAGTLQRYYALIEERRFEDARRLREPGPKLPSAQAFAAHFARFAEHRGQVGTPSAIARAKGAEYVEVPVQTYGRLATGPPFSSAGTITLRRTGGGPWRIYTSP
jgi:hypothetical protein